MTKTSVRVAMAAVAMAVPLLTMTTPADAAAPYFSSCDALHKKWHNGVAKGPVAANKAVRDGYDRPATTALAKSVYWGNYTRLDRDRDGTACETN
jgi:hypothetical protein